VAGTGRLSPFELRLSPFELKARLIELAAAHAGRAGVPMLDAGRGNPNWIATTPRAAFFLLGEFALGEARRSWDEPDLAGCPEPAGVADRLAAFLTVQREREGAALLGATVAYGASLGFDRDAFVYELVDGIVGDHYPGPDRILVHTERIVREYLADELCAGDPPEGTWNLFAVEGGTAAICYIFDSLANNFLLRPGDRIALMVPEFTPYLELPRLDRYDLDVVDVRACAVDQDNDPTWQFPDSEIDKLSDPKVRALFVVNPSNPPSVMIAPGTLERIAQVVRDDNPDLLVVTDDVYGTFVPGFVSLMDVVPFNTIAVYSFSKYFGATGWRLGVIALHEHNACDRRIAALSDAEKAELDRRYESISTETAKIPFIDRMVADSRQVALNHTAGLSLPQQVQMTLFAAFALLDRDQSYKRRTRAIVSARLARLHEGMGVTLEADPLRAGYYAEIDLLGWARDAGGPEFATWLAATHDPLEPVFSLATEHGIVLLHGGGFDDSAWSVRVSLANLAEPDYVRVGAALRAVIEGFVAEWERDEPHRSGSTLTPNPVLRPEPRESME
jgi:aspartate 4-decarboxylase